MRGPGEPNRSARAAALVAVLLLSACGRNVPEPAAPEPQPVALRPADVHDVRIEEVRSGPAISGTLRAAREAVVSARVTGRVLDTFAEQGERVAPGARLARLDEGSLRETLLSARSALRAAEAAFDTAERDEDRAAALVEAGALPRQDLERARTERSRAEAQLADARARLALAQEDVGETIVRAPFAGHVDERHVSAGNLVQPGAPLFTLLDLQSLQLEAGVPAQYLGHLERGRTLTFRVSGFPDEFTGTVDRISPSADPVTRQITIFVRVPNEDGRLAAGLFAEGRVATDVRETLAVPFDAIDALGTDPVVVRIGGDGRAERVPVTLGVRDEAGARAEVVDGLSAGDRVILGAARTISPGTPVTIDGAGDHAAAQ